MYIYIYTYIHIPTGDGDKAFQKMGMFENLIFFSHFFSGDAGGHGGMGGKAFEKMGMFENFVRFFDESEHAPNVNEKLKDFFQEPMIKKNNIIIFFRYRINNFNILTNINWKGFFSGADD
jgi:hypothetical protein